MKTYVPIQQVANGVVKIVVIEGYIANVRVNKNKAQKSIASDHLGIISSTIEKIKNIHAADVPNLEKYILLLNDLKAIEAKATIKSSSNNKNGAIDVELDLKDSNLPRTSFFVNIDNFGSKYMGPMELGIGGTLKKVLFSYDEIGIRGLSTLPFKKAQYLSANYKTPINSYGTSLIATSNYVKTKPTGVTVANNLIGNLQGGSIGLVQPIIRSKLKNLFTGVKLDAKNVSTNISGTNIYNDKIRAVRLSADFNNTDSYGFNALNITYSFGLNGLGATRTGSPNLSRINGRSDFRKIESNIARLQSVFNSFNLFLSLKGQYAFTSLLSSEEFSFGGQEFGKAYDPSEILDDHGFAGTLELRYIKLPKFYGFTTQPFVFYDYGKVFDFKNTNNNISKAASSTGFGIKFLHNKNINGSLYYAIPLKKKLNEFGDNRNIKNKILFNLGYAF